MRNESVSDRLPSQRRRTDVVLRVLRGEMTVAAAARHFEVPAREIERWQRRFLAAGKRALALDVAPQGRAARAGAAASATDPLATPPAEAADDRLARETSPAGTFDTARRWLRMLPEQAQGISWTTDAELRFTSINGVTTRDDGAPPTELLGLSLYDFFATDDAGFGPIANHLLALQGQPGSYESTFAGRAFHYRLEALRDADGSVQGVIGTALDVTERKRSETALHEHEARFRFLLEQLPVILWTTDADLCITSSIGAGLAALGLEPNELAGISLHDYVGSDPENSLIQGHFAALRGESSRLESRWKERDYDTYFEPLRGIDGAIVGVLGLTIDITERKLVDRQREELLARELAAREHAEAASRLKDEFLATVSHELRTPLNAILGWAHLLREDDLDPETRARAIETIERNSRAQARLIQDLLDVSNIVTGRTRLDIRPVADLAPIVGAALDSLRPAALAKSIELRQTHEAGRGRVLGDPERLQQIAWNLVSNAIKFTPAGGKVWVRLAGDDRRVQLVVSDTGEGIPPDFLPYVFDRFRQADASAARRHCGLGLGLAIVRHLVELQGGEVRAESAGEGRGATFTVTFPVLAGAALPAGDAGHAAASDLDPLGASLEGLRVMAIDDEPDTLDMIRLVLERCRAQVRTATSALEGLEQLARWTPDVLVADIGMPERDGYWLIRRVRDLAPERGGNVPAVALTAFAGADDRLRSLAAGYQTHVAKPVEPAELVAVISSLSRLRA
jgi:signal transduction histidine kinase/CheY-like chemotaxis protein